MRRSQGKPSELFGMGPRFLHVAGIRGCMREPVQTSRYPIMPINGRDGELNAVTAKTVSGKPIHELVCWDRVENSADCDRCGALMLLKTCSLL